jgi:hypothetical protein
MAVDRRNPYVILGVPFGAAEQSARRGFAAASRRLRDGGDAAYSMDDLTWALHQVEQIIEDPAVALNVYRIPANSDAIAIDQPGVFNPSFQNAERATAQPTPAEWETVRVRAARAIFRDALTHSAFLPAVDPPYQAKELTNGEE